jgi:hypothetical protein
MKAFRKARARDINLEVGVAREPGTATYWEFVEPALSTFDGAVATARLADGHALRPQVDLLVDTVAHLVDVHFASKDIDVLMVDVEGRDLEVLASLDWDRHSPRVVVVESSDEVCDLTRGPAAFLTQRGYTLYAATGLSRIFRLPASPP